MALSAAQLEQQKQQAEELLFSGPQKLGFVKALFFGHFRSDLVFPYPTLSPQQQSLADQAVSAVRDFAQQAIDAAWIDRHSEIPDSVIRGLGELGILGMTAPQEFGGKGFSQQMYCQVMEVLGGHDASTAVFVNAHHSIGIRALLLFGTPEQQRRWLPELIRGSQLAAFALTEEQAGSDAGNVQTTATPTPDGTGFLLNGSKRYITNGGIAQVLTVMARTPAPTPRDPQASKVTAFLVTPDIPGFEVLETRADKCGIRGTATGKLKFTNMFVPRDHVLGQIGKGLKVALTVLDFGRTTFGATCTGVAKRCLRDAIAHVQTRVQFQQPLAAFELVKKKIAFMGATTYAMEALTQHCAALIDRGTEDYMLETAILKVFATEHLWTIVNDTIQLFGGKAYFTDQPYERMMRDARINTIGEGANEVLKAFIAVVGCRGPGMELDQIRRGLSSRPWRAVPQALRYAAASFGRWLSLPRIQPRSAGLRAEARRLAQRVRAFGFAIPRVFAHCGSEVAFLESQYLQERLADVAIDLYASACVLSRLDATLTHRPNDTTLEIEAELNAGRYFLTLADRRIRLNLAQLWDNADRQTTRTAEALYRAGAL